MQIGDLQKIWREVENWGIKNFCQNVWSDFFLDRWWRSEAIRMTGAVASSRNVEILPWERPRSVQLLRKSSALYWRCLEVTEGIWKPRWTDCNIQQHFAFWCAFCEGIVGMSVSRRKSIVLALYLSDFFREQKIIYKSWFFIIFLCRKSLKWQVCSSFALDLHWFYRHTLRCCHFTKFSAQKVMKSHDL